MTSHPYHFTTSLTWGGDTPTGETEVECAYAVEWGYPASGPSYASGGEPGTSDAVDEITILSVDGKPWADVEWHSFGHTQYDAHDTLTEKLLADHEDSMIDAARDEDCSARDEWDDLRRQERDDR